MHSGVNIKQNNEKNRKRDIALSDTAVSLNLCFDRLSHSVDVLVEKAETLFYSSEYRKCNDLLDS